MTIASAMYITLLKVIYKDFVSFLLILEISTLFSFEQLFSEAFLFLYY